MSIKWVSKLSLDELLDLHRYAGGDLAVKCQRAEANGEETLYLTFLENWNGNSKLVSMDYEMDDFDGELSYNEPVKGIDDFREWMIHRFGPEYVLELVREKLNVNLIDYLDWSKEK
jgi:hypothetical protein